MPAISAEVTTGALQAFADAWNRHDADALMSFMTDDCVFEASAGAEVCGKRYAGSESVRAGFAGVSEWTFTGTRNDGAYVEVHGCDLFTFRDGKIALKNSYRKNRPLAAGPTR